MKIGELNGGWSMLIRINQVLIPILMSAFIGHSVWVVRTLQNHDKQLAVFEEWKSGRLATLTLLDQRVARSESMMARLQDDLQAEKLNLNNKLNVISTDMRLMRDQLDRLIKAIDKHIDNGKPIGFVP